MILMVTWLYQHTLTISLKIGIVFLTIVTATLATKHVMFAARSASLSRLDLEDECLHDERDDDL